MEERDKLRHRCHRNATRENRTKAAANNKADEEKRPAGQACRRGNQERRDHGNRHADHARKIALA